MKAPVARLLLAIAILLLLALAYTGIAGGIDQFDQSPHSRYTIGQIVQTVLQLVFGGLSLTVIAVWFWARQWSRAVFSLFVASVALAGGLAPVVWGQSSVLIGIVSGGASALIAWGIAALLRLSARSAA